MAQQCELLAPYYIERKIHTSVAQFDKVDIKIEDTVVPPFLQRKKISTFGRGGQFLLGKTYNCSTGSAKWRILTLDKKPAMSLKISFQN